ncbi:DUF4190 domain-containing protein [bacterium]|nr:DUF4190 domain-containing protein [bacterium]
MNSLFLCPACKAQLRPGARFCSACGSQVPEQLIAAAPPQSAPLQEQYTAPPPGSLPQYGMPYAQQNPEAPRSEAGYGLVPYKNGQALGAYYMGCFSFVLPLLAPLAIIFGVLGLQRAQREPQVKGQAHAVTGIVVGIIALGLWALLAWSWISF